MGGFYLYLAPNERRAGRELGCLFQGDQPLKILVHGDLLLDRGELDQLIGHLVGVQWVGWALVLDLRRQQGQEGIEIAPES